MGSENRIYYACGPWEAGHGKKGKQFGEGRRELTRIGGHLGDDVET